MEEALSRKRRIRAGHRATVTRSLGEVSTTLGNATPDLDRLSRLKLVLNEKLNTLNKLDSEILDIVAERELEDEIQQSDEYKDKIYEAVTLMDKLLVSTATPTPVTPATTPAARSTTADRTAKVRLPKIVLPHFSGNLMKWPVFWDSFKSAVHDNPDLINVDKFNYLRSLLERSAYDAIAGLTLSDANYQEAVSILTKRFGNKPMIVAKHMETLLNTEAVSSDHHLRDLRRLYDATESNIRSLKSLGVRTESYGSMLVSVLPNKLPPELRLIISRKMSSGAETDIDELLKLFEEELVARERASSSSTSRDQGRRSSGRVPHSTLFSGARETGPRESVNPTSLSCCYCQQQHSSKDCTSVTGVRERKQMLQSGGRCFNCLRKGHIRRTCRSTSKCLQCRGRHHTSICESQATSGAGSGGVPSLAQTGESTNPPRLNPGANPYTPPTTTTALCSGRQKSILLQTARCVLQNPKKPQKLAEIRLLLDSGSQKSYLSERAMQLLGLEPSKEQLLSIATFGSCKEKTRSCPVVEVSMSLKGYPPTFLSLYVVPTICEPLVSHTFSACKEQSQVVSGLDLADHYEGEGNLQVDMLVGSDYYWDLVTGSICKIDGGPTAVHTKLGWVLSGPTSLKSSLRCSVNLMTTHVLRVGSQLQEPANLEEQLRAFWELESLGIQREEKTLYDDFATSVTFRDGRYQVSLPWKDYHEPLPDNYSLSVKRLQGLLHRLRQDPDILREYDRTIKEQLEKGIIEALPDEGSTAISFHYLPHHAVVRQDRSTTKLRIVYNASAKSGGPSLNECLYKGPKFNQYILDLLLRFRAYRVAITVDVEKAFLMISVKEEDRDFLRFVWVKDVGENDPTLQTYRFTRVVFGVSSSPFLLNATIKFHLEKFRDSHQPVVERLLESTYVDDIVSGASSEDEGFEFYTASKELFRRGGFNLRKFVTSSKELQQKINDAEGATAQLNLPDPSTETYAKSTLGMQSPTQADECKILGVMWNTNSDTLMFDTSELAELATTLPPTKRNLVSLIGRFYDPLGYLSPMTIKFKMLFQKLCREKTEWDEPLPIDLQREWKELLMNLTGGGRISIPRSYLHGVTQDVNSFILCGFCDASTRAYAAVIYLVLETDSGIEVQFVVAKTRVAPTQTIPRLELLSALLLSRLITSDINGLKSTLPHLDVRCYTDSEVALYWIQGTHKEWKPFVENRVCEIRRCVKPEFWRHCPGKSNPADLPSRGLTLLEVSINQLWRWGPEWLCAEVDSVAPSGGSGPQLTMPNECSVELRASSTRVQALLSVNLKPAVNAVIDSSRYSSLTKLLRVTARVLLAVRKFKNHLTGDTISDLLPEAELLWVKDAQSSMTNFDVLQKQFNLFIDQRGLWRCRGRLSNVEAPYAVKNPILLPRKHPFSTLVVRDAHVRVYHDGIRETLTETRKKYWIPRVRSLARQLLHHCVVCRKHEGAPFTPPQPPPLPTFRVKDDPAFTYTGVDFAGPIYVRGRGGAPEKSWICLFTCYVTRAVHLDATPDQTTSTFLRCLKRFSARRGLPVKFISDNGKTFKAASKYLKSVFKDGTVKEYLENVGTSWKFNVERAPWWGGAFERLVRSTKRCLRKFVGRAQLSFDELVTVLAEIEAVINSRPLTYVSAGDIEEPLTPSHLIVGRRILNLPDHLSHLNDDDEEFSLNNNLLNRRMKHLANVLNHFWSRWRNEYLSELREVHSYTARRQVQGKPTAVAVGDVVVVHDEHLPRGLWRLGKVVSVMEGRDRFFRAATVKVSSKSGEKLLLNRPIQLLYPLEVQSHEPQNLEGAPSDEPEGETRNDSSSDRTTESQRPVYRDDVTEELTQPTTSNPLRRSQRVASQRADANRKACIFELEDD